ncbi:hypothetical protein AQUCO_00500448v1 [Aquilegia coerulea]|uniref:CAND6/7 N-terminal domain-containing protein n=1 Tax=Aquilegia coerulea TaxID=218851 RepID=A0A2G5ES06_AQUCA|nr:hypothetical protein AQUCO_00500448v1 [Aquilegia coerulea]
MEYHHPVSLFFTMPVLLLLLFFFSPCLADIRHTKIRPKDPTPEHHPSLMFIDVFGFTKTGRIELNVSHISFSNHPSHLNLSHQIGFLLAPRLSASVWDPSTTCYLQSDFVKVLYTFHFEGAVSQSPINNLNLVFSVTDPDEFILYFENCLHPQLNSSMDIHSAMYNLDLKSGKRNYLSAGMNYIIGVCVIGSCIYLLLSVLFLIHSLLPGKKISSGVVLFFAVYKLTSFIVELTYLYYMKHIGYSQSLVSVTLNSTFTLFGGILPLYIFLFLTAVGWPFLTQILQEGKSYLKTIIFMRVVYSIVFDVLIAVAWPGTFIGMCILYSIGSHLCDISCLSMILLPIKNTTKNLLHQGHGEGEAAPVFRKVKIFRQLYFAVIIFKYIYFLLVTSFEIFALLTKYQWTGILVEESTIFAMYLFVVYTFWPMTQNQAFLVKDGEEEFAAAEALKDLKTYDLSNRLDWVDKCLKP